ncbi:MAG: phosphatidylinositol-3-phosphatase, partial [Mycobacterium sp.]|nr:phosphatidylinositol-3-phosphatase [Mycobacterium sp.]
MRVLAGIFAPVVALALYAPVATAAAIPTPSHIVILVEENKPSGGVLGNNAAPFINSVAKNGALMTQSYAVAHPSEP